MSTIWAGVFIVLLGVGFSLKLGEYFSRGATLSFFVLGLIAMLAWRRLLAQVLRHALATGAFAERNVILICERGRGATPRTILEMRQCGYKPIRTFEIGHEEFSPSKISRKLSAAVDGAIEAARAESAAEILLLIGWEHSWTIESIARMLSVLPIPIFLLPDGNVSHYLRRRTANLGLTWAAEIQRAPLTKAEQFAKHCFDLAGAA